MAVSVIFMAISVLILSFTSPLTAQVAPAPSPAAAPVLAPRVVNLTDLLSHAGPFSTFLAHLNNTQVIQTFQDRAENVYSDQGITIFSPTDAAFSTLDKPSLASLSNDQLKSVLLFHAFPMYYTLTDLSKNVSHTVVATLAGGRFTLNITDFSGTIRIDSGWTKTNISSSVYSGVPVSVYQIDQVLIPEAIFGAAPSTATSFFRDKFMSVA